MATNRPTTRRRSARQAFDDDDAPAPKRVKADVKKANSAGASAAAAAKKAAKVAYDENDDGFQFSRRTSRRTAKAQAVPAHDPIPEHDEPKPAAKPAPRRKKNTVSVPEPDTSDAHSRRRSARISGDRESLEMRPKSTEPLVQKRTRKSVAPEKEKKKKAVTPTPETRPEQTRAFARVQTPTQEDDTVAKKRDPNAQRIMLPFADTPVITRNKEMRKGNKDGHRRSSTGLRGRRASSLIDSGMSNALPHSEVEVRDYYKYIEQSLPEPRRMKQLLTWCGSRALPTKPSGDVKNANAIMAARAIQQELIDDFANKPELSYWFDREDTGPTPVTRKPNPQNEKNKSTLEELEAEIKRLEEEKAAWESLVSSSNSIPPPAPSIQAPTFSLADIDASLLDPTQAPILAALQQSTQQDQSHPESSTSPAFTFTTAAALQTHLTKLSLSLEPSIDLFTDGVHKIEQYRNTADRVADRVLGTAAKRLDERDREIKERAGAEGIGVGDILRGLAGVLSES